MAVGPGKYDDLCTEIREGTKAEGVILMVFHGDKGSGFSVQAPLDLVLSMPEILRDTAKQIEESRANGDV